MFWTGHQRDTSSVLAEQKAKTPEKLESLFKIRSHAQQMQELLGSGGCDLRAFGSILNESWQQKRRLASTITNNQIDTWYQRASDAGAWGGKLCGAGGGGFLLFLVPPDRQNAVRQALADLQEVPVGPEAHGSQILFVE
jgi:D-glycero-alpha-D-manno-heptose-7-phosphate kinase